MDEDKPQVGPRSAFVDDLEVAVQFVKEVLGDLAIDIQLRGRRETVELRLVFFGRGFADKPDDIGIIGSISRIPIRRGTGSHTKNCGIVHPLPIECINPFGQGRHPVDLRAEVVSTSLQQHDDETRS